jgi:transposase
MKAARGRVQIAVRRFVADPNFAPMYATRSRRVKTDRRDAQTLAEACKVGAHRTSEAQRHVRAELAIREAPARTRSRYISLAKALAGRDGLRLAPGAGRRSLHRLAALELPQVLAGELAPLVALLRPLNEQIAAAMRALWRSPSTTRSCGA